MSVFVVQPLFFAGSFPWPVVGPKGMALAGLIPRALVGPFTLALVGNFPWVILGPLPCAHVGPFPWPLLSASLVGPSLGPFPCALPLGPCGALPFALLGPFPWALLGPFTLARVGFFPWALERFLGCCLGLSRICMCYFRGTDLYTAGKEEVPYGRSQWCVYHLFLNK